MLVSFVRETTSACTRSLHSRRVLPDIVNKKDTVDRHSMRQSIFGGKSNCGTAYKLIIVLHRNLPGLGFLWRCSFNKFLFSLLLNLTASIKISMECVWYLFTWCESLFLHLLIILGEHCGRKHQLRPNSIWVAYSKCRKYDNFHVNCLRKQLIYQL